MKAKQTKRPAVRLKKTVRRHLKLAFVPHKANQYRPHLIRRYGLMGVLLVIIAAQVGYNLTVTGTVLGEKSTMTPDVLLASTNAERSKAQLSPLKIDEKLSQAAFLKGKDMFEKQYWAHTAPSGTTPWQWFGKAGYNYAFAGENLAKNFRTADAVLTAWMASPEHEANILSKNYSDVGFAVVDGILDGKNTTIVVALYGAPASNGVAGVRAAAESDAAANHAIGPLTRLGMAVQAMSPAALGSIFIMLLIMGVALVAHVYRDKLPKRLRVGWYRHHGLAKAGGMAVLSLVVIVLYSGGQI